MVSTQTSGSTSKYSFAVDRRDVGWMRVERVGDGSQPRVGTLIVGQDGVRLAADASQRLA